MNERNVTLIVSPRERFGVARESLLSIFAHTQQRYELIYVDCGVDALFSDWLDQQAGLRGFRILRPGLVTPNEARNLGLKLVSTQYVVFIDNDVIVAPGWLDAMINCANDETADIVAPLTCQGLPLHQTIHQAGGSLLDDPMSFFAQPAGERIIVDQHAFAGQRVAQVATKLRRAATGSCEFHCVLVRRSLFDWIGPLDERLLASREHLDLCLAATQAGKKIVFEPAAIVSYLFPSRQRPMNRADWHYFALRWSPSWLAQSVEHFEHKWGLRPPLNSPGHGQHEWRLFEGLVKPLLRAIPGTARNNTWQRICAVVLRQLCRQASELLVRHDQRRRANKRAAGSRPLASAPAVVLSQ